MVPTDLPGGARSAFAPSAWRVAAGRPAPSRLWRRGVQALLLSLLTLLTVAASFLLPTARAQGFAAGQEGAWRAGQVASVEGTTWVFDADAREWTTAFRNRPVAPGDRFSTGADGRLEMRFASTVVRVGPRSEIEVRRLDDETVHLHLQTGQLALRVRDRAGAGELRVSTPEGRFVPLQPGHYRIDREDEVTMAGTWNGDLLFDETPSVAMGPGHRQAFWRERRSAGAPEAVQTRPATWPEDVLAAWALNADAQEPRTVSTRALQDDDLPQRISGIDQLERHGRWDRHPDLGLVWMPLQVQVGWAPFTDGRWVWVSPWGWTWIDAKPWGFAPFHYGHWVQWRGRWVWSPGPRGHRHVFIPAPVRWHGPGKPHEGYGHRRPPLPGSHWTPWSPEDRTWPRPGVVPVPGGTVRPVHPGWDRPGGWKDDRRDDRRDERRDWRDERRDDRRDDRRDWRDERRDDRRDDRRDW
ncbi:MAG: DUF6600 domain-containing protein, partial [Rubrivivax sp.]